VRHLEIPSPSTQALPMSWHNVLRVVLALVLLGVAVGAFLLLMPHADQAVEQHAAKSDSTSSSNAPAHRTLTKSTYEPFVQDAIREELELNDPRKDGWDSEWISEQMLSQLKTFGEAVLRGKEEASKEIRCSALRPDKARVVFDDGKLAISRWNESLPLDQNLATASKQLMVPWAGATESPYVSFKVIRIQFDASNAESMIRVQVAGKTRDGFVQQNSLWRCRFERLTTETLALRQVELADFEEVVRRNDRPWLNDCTQSVCQNVTHFREQFGHGIDYWRDSLDWRLGLDVAGPHGLAVGDVNSDGLDDLFVCEPGGLPNRLLVQHADGTVRDESKAFGVDLLEPATSALFLDLDNDDDQDLVLTSGRFVIVCENNGQQLKIGSVTKLTGIARSICAADYDNDKLLDVYVCSYINRDVALDDVGLGMPMPYHDANNGPGNYLLRNVGSFQLEDVTKMVGLDTNNSRFSYAASWEDFDLDGDLDLYVANDFGRNNLYQNTDGVFQDVAASAGVEDVATGMSVSWGDCDRDGLPDLYVGNMFSTAGNRIMYQRQFQTGTAPSTRKTFQRLARGNSLFRNQGDGTFQDVSETQRVTLGRWAWGSMFADLNNDGFDDILVANGMITSKDDSSDL